MVESERTPRVFRAFEQPKLLLNQSLIKHEKNIYPNDGVRGICIARPRALPR